MKNKYKIKYSPLFFNDLMKIVSYIKNELNNETAANNLVDEVEKGILSRENFPASYEVYQSSRERKNKYYKIYVKNYIIFYTVNDNVMEVRRMIYSKRNFRKFI